jgi:hypothetical protein
MKWVKPALLRLCGENAAGVCSAGSNPSETWNCGTGSRFSSGRCSTGDAAGNWCLSGMDPQPGSCSNGFLHVSMRCVAGVDADGDPDTVCCLGSGAADTCMSGSSHR